MVGLTGGIASGKSTVSSLLASHRIPIIDADILAREVVAPGTKGFKLIVDHFGRDRILRDDGGLDRAALGEIVFKDGDERRSVIAFFSHCIPPPIPTEDWYSYRVGN